MEAAGKHGGQEVGIGHAEEQEVVQKRSISVVPAEEEADAAAQKNAEGVVSAEDGVFEEEVIPEGNEDAGQEWQG